MQELKNQYPSVEKDGTPSYGGNQGWSHKAVMRKCGCGAVAGTDLLLYLHRNRSGCQTEVFRKVPKEGPLSLAMYNVLLDQMCRKYFLVVPHFGMNGLTVTVGLNHYFRTQHVPLRARWAVWGENLWKSVAAMLEDDFPVIFSIGPNAPFFWMNHKVRLYVKTADGTYLSSCMVKAHYVTITGMDERWLKISSWGKEYYINREEYTRYVKKYSSYLVSNIVYLKPQK